MAHDDPHQEAVSARPTASEDTTPALATPGPAFTATPPAGGYVWWYVDAISDDGREALTLIAFVGSVFSPYYAWRGWRDPQEHCALNVALYAANFRRWAMTERGRADVRRDEGSYTIARSRVAWEDDALVYDIDEPTSPFPGRLQGKVRVRPVTMFDTVHRLDAAGRHLWRPIAPIARAEIAMTRPEWRWRGHAYLDANTGAEPLEKGFARWDWSRAHGRDGAAAILYDADRRDGGATSFALRFSPTGAVETFEPPPFASLPRGFWGAPRRTRADAEGARLVRALEDTPFYTRSLITTRLAGATTLAVHESLSLDRFANPIVRRMLPVRMPRRA